MQRKLILLTIICAALFLTSCTSRRRAQDEYAQNGQVNEQEHITEEPPIPEPPRLVYIALGDSVSEGFGIWSPQDRHTAIFFEMLKTQGYANEYVNMAVSGFTTTDLLSLLHNLHPVDLDSMLHASVITLNIGGNNILAPFWDYLPDTDEIGRITDETISFVSEAWELVQEIMEFMGESREAIEDVLLFANEVVDFAENFSFMDIFRLNEMIAAAPPVIDGAMEVFAEVGELETAVNSMIGRTEELEIIELFSLFSGNFPAELEAEFQAGIRRFSYEFIEILAWLENNAPYAAVIVNTVYNPLPTQVFGMPIGFADESQRLIQSINRVIYEESSRRGFIVSDVYTNLSNRPDMMNFSFDIIHPNPAGHNIIAELNFSDFMQVIVTP